MKALVISHAHPAFSIGGAEVAAYNLYRALPGLDDISEAVFLARTDLPGRSHGSISLFRENEYLWRQGIGDWFRLSTENRSSVLEEFREFLLLVRPDIVFVQHFLHLGVEIFPEIKRTLPKCFLVATLHEYLAICNRNGQFVRNVSKKLCYEEEIERCSTCFPEYSAGDFWLRKHYIQSQFSYVDIFVSPSAFLMSRYIDWGISAERITVIENGQPARSSHEAASVRAGRVRFGYFGQINEYKGLDILLSAVGQLPESVREQIVVDVNGANLESQGEWFQDLIKKLREPLIEEGCLRWAGAYEPHEVSRRMRNVDWVVVPSIWWENSPMVIQEAFVHGRPVICSNIGGMAEKVRDGVDGLHFEVRNPLDLADVLARAATEEGLHARLSGNAPTPIGYADCARLHVDLLKGGFRRFVSE